jgi:CRISPR-associated protein Cmr1
MNSITNQKILNTYELECKIITPLFMGGAEFNPELRTQSINGILRWWFRVAGGNIEDEKRLFGWASNQSNQGLVRLFIKDFDKLKTQIFSIKDFDKIKTEMSSKEFDQEGKVRNNRGLNYLGFSLDKKRSYIKESQTFNLIISFHPRATEEDEKKFFATLWLAFNLGNFGSRSRRGFGSIKITSINNSNINDLYSLSFNPNQNLNQNLNEWINQNLNKIKAYINPTQNAFDSLKIYKIEKSNFNQLENWLKEVQNGRNGKFLKNQWGKNNINNHMNLLDFMGFLLAAFRSYRNPDYQNAKNILQKKLSQNNTNDLTNNLTFERAIFGLPLNFHFSSLKKYFRDSYKGTLNAKLKNQTLRRASPLIIKILECNNNYEGIFIVIKSQFLPDSYSLYFLDHKVYLPKEKENEWEAINKFIDSLKNKNLISKIK